MLIFNYKRFYSNINGAIDNYIKRGTAPTMQCPKILFNNYLLILVEHFNRLKTDVVPLVYNSSFIGIK